MSTVPSAAAPPAASPGGRTGAAMVYDATRREVLLFGGYAAGAERYPNDLWAWNGHAWRSLPIPEGKARPRGRDVPHLAYDAGRARVVMFGGRREPSGQPVELLSDVWEWDGGAWREISDTGLPALVHGAVAYDPGRRRVAVYGGLDASGFSRSLWEWDGRHWTLRDAAGPEGYFAGGAAIGPKGELVVITTPLGNGRRSGPPPLSRTWTWTGERWLEAEAGPPFGNLQATATAPDGTLYFYQSGEDWLDQPILHVRDPHGAWIQLPMGTSPGMRSGATAAYDAKRHRLVLFGGRFSGRILGDTWEFDGRQWIPKGSS